MAQVSTPDWDRLFHHIRHLQQHAHIAKALGLGDDDILLDLQQVYRPRGIDVSHIDTGRRSRDGYFAVKFSFRVNVDAAPRPLDAALY